MSELLVQLERNLWSRKEQLTLEEQTFFHKYKIKAFCQFMNGSIAGFVLGLTATKKLNNILLKSALTSVVATTFGVRRFDESLDSTVDHILTLDGSRLQIELARVVVNNHQNDSQMMGLISKRFYLEEVFDDLSLKRRFRLHYRNFYSDQGAHDDSKNDTQNASASDFHTNFDYRKTDLRSKQIPVNSGIDMTAVEESHHCSTSSTPSRAQSRVRKRANRRRRLQNHEGCLGSNDEEARPQGHGVDGQRLANRPTGRGFEA